MKTYSDGSNYKANGILLRDGIVIKELELREHEVGALFILQFGEHDSTEHFVVMIGVDQLTYELRMLSIRESLDRK